MTLEWRRIAHAVYGAALMVSILVWLLAIRSPLWLDETGSYWQISAGLSQIWSRQFETISFPAYSYILWLSTKLIGTSEVALRIPSLLAMLVAVYLLYRVGERLFGREIGTIAAIVFCLNPIVVFEAIDVRPYAFAILLTNAAMLLLLRIRTSDSTRLAFFFGLAAAGIAYFQFLYVAILPAFALCLLYFKGFTGKTVWRQYAAAVIGLTLGFLPLVPGLLDLFRTAKSHVFETAPSALDLLWTLAPGGLIFLEIALLILIARLTVGADRKTHYATWQMLFCGSMALIPILILFGTSAATPIHLFVARHRLIAVPGISLCWAMLLGSFRLRALRVVVCAAYVTIWGVAYFASPAAARHEYTWKFALQVAERNASVDDAPVLVCSDFPEADYVAMPLEAAKESKLFAPLSYYRLSVPVAPLPRSLNAEAIRVGSHFLKDAELRHERFLAMAYVPSEETLHWLARKAGRRYSVHSLGIYDGVKVLEFQPK